MQLIFYRPLIYHADPYGNDGRHVEGIETVEVLKDESDGALFPFHAESFGHDYGRAVALGVGFGDFDGIDVWQRGPRAEVLRFVVDYIGVGLYRTVPEDVLGYPLVLCGDIEIVVCARFELAGIALPVGGSYLIFLGVDGDAVHDVFPAAPHCGCRNEDYSQNCPCFHSGIILQGFREFRESHRRRA